MMIAGTSPARFLAELRLPPGFSPVDPHALPDLPDDEILRIEIVDFAGVVRSWQWSDCPIDWHEALGWRFAPDGLSEECEVCGRLTHLGYRAWLTKEWSAICEDCDCDDYAD